MDRVPEYNKYCLSVRSPPFSIKGAERSGRKRAARARRNYFLRFARRANIPGKRRFNIALPHENSPETERERPRSAEREQNMSVESCGEIVKRKKKEERKRRARRRDRETKVERYDRVHFVGLCVRACVHAAWESNCGRQFRGRVSSASEKKAPMYKHDRMLILVFIRA